jgi:antitoxin component of RelBE/YafQ-DinJ toxin-antitoxin module
MESKPLIAAKVEADTKAAFADLARRRGQTESDLLRAILGSVLKQNPSPAPLPAGFKNTTGEFYIRLRKDELQAAQALAKADARSVPAWIVALIRRVALKAIPFNERELTAINKAIAALGPLGRNVNVLVKHFHQTGRSSAEDLQAGRLADAIQQLRAEVVALAERASRRFEEDEE